MFCDKNAVWAIVIFVSASAISLYFQAKNSTTILSASSAPPKLKTSEDVLDSCFIAGESAATVYVANMGKLASNDLMPSTVMQKACEDKGATTINPKSCIEQCELGFRKIAREVFNEY